MEIGYTFLVQKCAPGTIVPRVSAETAPVKRKIQKNGRLLVPTGSFLETDDLLAHIAFAIAHEGINMQILAQVLPLVKAADIQSLVEAKPTSLVSRRTGWLWELFTGRLLDFKTTASKYEPLFDPKRYLTRENGERSPKWKIIFNGLGTSKWCATVERTLTIEKCVTSSILERVAEWFTSIGQLNAERALGWAYLNETKGSFELEKG